MKAFITSVAAALWCIWSVGFAGHLLPEAWYTGPAIMSGALVGVVIIFVAGLWWDDMI